jgi:hypothetical protein
MDHQIPAQMSNRRFPGPLGYATFAIGKELIVEPTVDPVDAMSEAAAHANERPRASDWLWRPMFAKLWWIAIPVYWMGMAASLKIPVLAEFYTSALAGFLNVAFFPPLALMVLGLGFARAWFEWSDWEFVEPTHEQMFPKRSVGGMRDPASDPLDPRSGLHWQHFHRHR